MGNELKLNSAEEAEVVLIRLTPEEYPIAYANKVKCLMLSGLSKKEAERMAMEPIDLELYYEVGVGLMAVEPGAVEAGTIYSPYSIDAFLKKAEGYPVDVDLETQGFYRCNDAGTLPGECADFIFHKCND